MHCILAQLGLYFLKIVIMTYLVMKLMARVGRVSRLKIRSEVAKETMNKVGTWFLVEGKFRRAEIVMMFRIIPEILKKPPKTPANMPSGCPNAYSLELQGCLGKSLYILG